MPTFGLNFSRPGAQVALQYYNFLRLGFEGYRQVHQASRDTAVWLADQIDCMGPFEVLSDGRALPTFAFKLRDPSQYTVFDISDSLRGRGWIVPAYRMPPAMEDIAVLRIVVRNGFSRDLARFLLTDLEAVIHRFDSPRAPGAEIRTGFHH